MNLPELTGLYVIAGLISACVLERRSRDEVGARRWVTRLLALLLWPLWLPVALGRQEPAKASDDGPTVNEQALFQGYDAVKGTPLEKLLPRESVERIALEIRRVVARDRELSALLSQSSFSLEAARARVRELVASAPDNLRALAMAQRHLDNVERLAALHAHDHQLLAELGDWLLTLRTQLVLARYSAGSAEGVGDIFAEVCARVEVLGSTLEEPLTALPAPPAFAWPSISS